MKKHLIIAIATILIVSGISMADHLVDKHNDYNILQTTNHIILQYLEEQEMGGAHITVTFSSFSTAHMERITARSNLGL